MKKLLSTVTAVALLSSAALANPVMDKLDTDNAYVGGGIAMETFSELDAGYALILNYGVPV